MVDNLGLVLATYNEAGNLPLLVEWLEGLNLPLKLHIYVVDDNSPDGTSSVADRLASQYGNISLITRPRKMGLGSAIRDGMSAALLDGRTHIITMDADLSHDAQDVPRLVEASISGGADVVQASRYVIGGGTLKWRWRRHFQSRVANLLWRTLLGSPRDSTTNFRIFNKRAAQLVVEKSIGRDFEFMPECILIAMSHGLRIVEVPIIFTGRAAGESKLGLAQNVRWLLFLIGTTIAFKLRIGRFSRQSSR